MQLLIDELNDDLVMEEALCNKVCIVVVKVLKIVSEEVVQNVVRSLLVALFVHVN